MSVSPLTLPEFLARVPADKIAVILPEQNISITYGGLRAQVQAVAEQLAAVGVRRGDRVATSLTNGLPVIVSFLAAGAVGTAAPLNPAYKEDEFKFYLEDTAAKVLILPPEGADEARRAAVARGVPILSIDMDAAGTVTLGSGLARQPFTLPTVDDVALVLHTSGSTGRPKRVPLKHANLSISAQNVARSYALSPDDVSLCVMPLFHVHGLVASTLATFASGGTVVVPAKFSPLSFWRTARDHGVTWYSAVPTLHQLLLARAGDPSDPSRRPAGTEKLRFIRSCSASLPPAVMHALEAAFGAPVLEAYGMTEAAHQMASNPLPPSARKPGSVGRGTDVQISIMDDTGELLGPGETGEVLIKGPNVTAGYVNNEKANAEAFTNGWFRTGDQGYLDPEGYLFLTGRLKEIINRGGEKISPREIDEVLLDHPAVAQVCTFAMPHDRLGEEVAVAVVLVEGITPASERDLRDFCTGRLADFKIPRKVVILSEIPKGARGRVQRIGLAEKLGVGK